MEHNKEGVDYGEEDERQGIKFEPAAQPLLYLFLLLLDLIDCTHLLCSCSLLVCQFKRIIFIVSQERRVLRLK